MNEAPDQPQAKPKKPVGGCKLPQSKRRRIFSLRREGKTVRQIAEIVGVAQHTAHRYAREADDRQRDAADVELAGVPVEALAVLVEQCGQAPCPRCSVLLLYLRTQRTVWCQSCGKMVTR